MFAGLVTEASSRGFTSISFGETVLGSFELWPLVLAVTWQSVAEYYWHRVMHWPSVYKRLHKLHHHYKAPQPFDDLFIHPVEGFGYYCILYSPVIALPRLPLGSFLVYMAIMGLCGVLDHCGVRIELKGIYSTMEHDAHHEHFSCNYAFPFVFMDVLHGTLRPRQVT
mmetsp:Transcript_1148/g.2090  ORF Transcript_1148/g.2090 Transcript_1148/m.2090 type:complete len:167 (+) Transcript_1148:112-612(+)